MPRGGSRRGGARGGSHHNGRARGKGPRTQNWLSEQPSAFTMADEARSTAHGGSAWSKDSCLRSRPVGFVSAGAIDPLKQLEEQLQRRASEALNHMSHEAPITDSTHNIPENKEGYSDSPRKEGYIKNYKIDLDVTEEAAVGAVEGLRIHDSTDGDDLVIDQTPQRSSDTIQESLTSVKYPLRPDPWVTLERHESEVDHNVEVVAEPQDEEPLREPNDAAADPNSVLFFFDTTGDSSNRTKDVVEDTANVVEDTANASPEPASDSSEEVILFKGRNQTRQQMSYPARTQHRRQSPTLPSRNERCTKRGILLQESSEGHDALNKLALAMPTGQSDRPRSKTRKERKREKTENKKNRKKGKGKKASPSVPLESTGEEDALIEDYISNMRENGDTFNLVARKSSQRRDIGGDGMDVDSSDVDEEYPETVPDNLDVDHEHLKQQSRTSGETVETDMYEPGFTQTDPAAESQIDELLLTALAEDSPGLRDDIARQMEIKVSQEKGPAATHDNDWGGFDDSDELDDYDFMDWGEPVFRGKRKSKGKPPVFDISDSEIEAKLQAAFKKDRMKKADKKKEREELRAKGLLGSKADPDDLRVKYQHGMSLEQIAQELKGFLLSNQTSLTLPPMDNHARKVMHELANKFNIKSKSTGAGDQRRPTLYRTLRTFKYSEDTFEAAISRVGRKYFPRKDRMAASSKAPRQANKSGGGNAATSYRDGEVVGGAAPELGNENRGRAMLEKMGWSSGTALGALTNKGILQPVEQKVKRGKAGLG